MGAVRLRSIWTNTCFSSWIRSKESNSAVYELRYALWKLLAVLVAVACSVGDGASVSALKHSFFADGVPRGTG
ncbi:MAG: hypothetical protein CL861_05035 [Cyanobium sp. MED843]|nr:hypothetical protein [Cyanobium sp. MED843]OUW29077.1 MAG: hypothetical protein CBD37_04335 [Cyanobacteria bacterium TMED177]